MIDFAIITPLIDEWLAFQKQSEDSYRPRRDYVAAVGTMGSYRVLICKPLGKGQLEATDFTRRIVTEWKPRWVLLAGVAGSLRPDLVRPGDVVVASKVYDYEYGKVDGGRFSRRPDFDFDPARDWASHLELLERQGFDPEASHWHKIKAERPDNNAAVMPTIHYGPIASGEKVVDEPDYAFFKEARDSLPELYAIEMEGAGVGTAVRNLALELQIGFLMIRGISDVPRSALSGDELRGTGQRDSWKPYASAAAAAVTQQLLSSLGVPIGRRVTEDHEGADTSLVRPKRRSQPSLRELKSTVKNAPAQATPFIGRASTVGDISELLLHPDTRILTLYGAGGIGKTRLALRVAESVAASFEDGIFFVPLAAVTDPQSLIPVIAQILNVRETGNRQLIQTLQGRLRDKHLLLVLDNFEQISRAAPQVSDLLRCPSVKILVTSRKLLRVDGEVCFPVLPMRSPDLRSPAPSSPLGDYDSVQLFVAAAQRARPDFSLTSANAPHVASICAHLEGIPLSIELAAARIKDFSPHALLNMLQDRLGFLQNGPVNLPPRHKSIRATMQWSYRLLSRPERVVFRRMGVFVGGCSPAALNDVCNPDGAVAGNPSDLATLLASSSLVRIVETATGEPRFAMLETIREYALHQVKREDQNAEQVRRAHATYFLALAERVEPELRGAKQAEWMARLDEDHDNFRAALGWSASVQGISELGLRLATALSWYWSVRGFYAEGRQWLEATLDSSPELAASLRIKGLLAAAYLANQQGYHRRASILSTQAYDLATQHGDKNGVAWSLHYMGRVSHTEGDYDSAQARQSECLQLFRDCGDKHGVANALGWLGLVARVRADYSAAQSLHEESLAEFRDLKSTGGIAWSLNNLARVAHDLGDLTRADGLLRESESRFRQVGDKRGIALSLAARGLVLTDQGRTDPAKWRKARGLLKRSLILSEEIGDRFREALTYYYMGRLDYTRRELQQATKMLDRSLSLAKEIGYRRGIALSERLLGQVVLAGGDPLLAKQLVARSLELCLASADREGVFECLAVLTEVFLAEGNSVLASHLMGALRAALHDHANAAELVSVHPAIADAIQRATASTDSAQPPMSAEDGSSLTLVGAAEMILSMRSSWQAEGQPLKIPGLGTDATVFLGSPKTSS